MHTISPAFDVITRKDEDVEENSEHLKICDVFDMFQGGCVCGDVCVVIRVW